MTKPTTVLAIESAIAGGSISLRSDGEEVGNWIGNEASVSKAEDLLVNIDKLLEDHGLNVRDVDLVAVSAGPGSFTGIRIGIATALGLKAGLSIDMASESALKAIVYQRGGEHKKLIAGLPVGRNSVCIQRFRNGEPIEGPRTIEEVAFADLITGEAGTTFLMHQLLHHQIGNLQNSINAGSNIALAIGLICSQRPPAIAEPLFIAKSF
jgi:tRNA threonylcarbamoyl adenosine modification protein YeaZ